MCECLQWQNALINILWAIYVPKCSSYFNIHRAHEKKIRTFQLLVQTIRFTPVRLRPQPLPHSPFFVIPHGWLYTLITNNNTATTVSHTSTLLYSKSLSHGYSSLSPSFVFELFLFIIPCFLLTRTRHFSCSPLIRCCWNIISSIFCWLSDYYAATAPLEQRSTRLPLVLSSTLPLILFACNEPTTN